METKLVQAFQDLGVTPRCDSAEDFKQWMAGYVKQLGEVKDEKKDVERLIVTQNARLPPFSGDPTVKGETTYDLWRYEVECLRKDKTITPEALGQLVRRSLRGNAGKVAMRLGTDASIADLLRQVECNYGVVEDQEALMGKFYNARQEETEDVATWGYRLEDLLTKATRMEPLPTVRRNQMLHSRIWKGLRPNLKDRSAAKYDLCAVYEDFKVELRRIESEVNADKRKMATVKVACGDMPSPDDQRYEKLEGMIKQLTSEVRVLKSSNSKPPKPKPQQHQHQQQQHKQQQRQNFPQQDFQGDAAEGYTDEPEC
ncbi:uncharacterized protein LOC132560286 [Ylistrum balloti]|uniref:uncharacterized protein LOC132560286 n=1 Tax=Ylistrum balloti TaxID=509963 RepID=UPI002905AA10|nr:uncharacterized protein LOC132560286 [Ylistrum balloti]